MYNEVHVNGVCVNIVDSTQLLTAIDELKILLDMGCNPVDVSIWWTDEDGRYHDLSVLDGDWFHQYEVIRSEFEKVEIF